MLKRVPRRVHHEAALRVLGHLEVGFAPQADGARPLREAGRVGQDGRGVEPHLRVVRQGQAGGHAGVGADFDVCRCHRVVVLQAVVLPRREQDHRQEQDGGHALCPLPPAGGSPGGPDPSLAFHGFQRALRVRQLPHAARVQGQQEHVDASGCPAVFVGGFYPRLHVARFIRSEPTVVVVE